MGETLDELAAAAESQAEALSARRASLASVAGVPVNTNRVALVTDILVASGRARVLGFGADNTGAAGIFVQLFDSTQMPADGATPLRSWSLAAGASLDVAFETHGRWFYSGCRIIGSSTQATKTIITSAVLLIDVQSI